jgi:hypothetical protein
MVEKANRFNFTPVRPLALTNDVSQRCEHAKLKPRHGCAPIVDNLRVFRFRVQCWFVEERIACRHVYPI